MRRGNCRSSGPAVCAILLSFILLTASILSGQELPFTHYTQESEVAPLPSADVRSI
jgi:hypothetical protein